MINKEKMLSRLKQLKDENNYTQEDLAVVLNTVRQTYSKYENGQSPIMLDDAIKLCNFYDCDIGYLIGEYDTKKHIVADVCSVTGLSENAVEKLIQNKKDNETKYTQFRVTTHTINKFIEQGIFDIIHDLTELIDGVEFNAYTDEYYKHLVSTEKECIEDLSDFEQQIWRDYQDNDKRAIPVSRFTLNNKLNDFVTSIENDFTKKKDNNVYDIFIKGLFNSFKKNDLPITKIIKQERFKR